MAFIDFILNLAGLLLWLNWRSCGFDPLEQTRPGTLVGSLKRTESHHLKGWQLGAALVLLLIGRALFYWFIGTPVDWTPKLMLGVISLAFRSDLFRLMLFYSALSFGQMLLVFYFWLLFLSAVNRSVLEPDPMQKWVRLHLGRAAHWPWPAQLLLPLSFVASVWVVLNPLLAHLGVITPVHSIFRLAGQAFLIGLGLLFSLKYLLPAILLLHVISSYVFLGNSPVWDFLSTTTRNLLKPLRPIPLRLARLDFAPAAGVLLVFFLLEWLPNYLVGRLTDWKVSFWPQ